MRPEYQALAHAYIERQKAKGRRGLRKVPYYLDVYFRWLDDRGLRISDVNALAAEEFQTYLATKENDGQPHYTSGTVGGIVATVDMFHRWLTEEGHMLANPFYGLKRVKREQKLPRNVPSQDEMAEHLEKLRRFWDAQAVGERRALYRLHVIAELLYATGMRIDELARITPEDIDWAGNVVLIREGKGGATRLAYLNEYAARVLSLYVTTMRDTVNWNRKSPTVFGTSSGRTIDPAINKHFKRLFGFTSHTFRHALGTHLLQRGCDLRYIQLILGHDDLDSTAIYTKASKDDLRNELDKRHPRSG